MESRRPFERMMQDLRFAWRLLWRSPGFAAVALCTLALGIGATTAIFTVVNAVVLRPLDFPDPDRLVMVWERSPGSDGTRGNVVQTQNFLDWHARNRSFEGIAALMQMPMTLSGTGEAEQMLGLAVSADFFRVLGIEALLGRTFKAEEDVPGGPVVVVLGHRLWQQRFGGDPRVLGKTVTINGAVCEIIGVMPADFSFPVARPEFYTPMKINPKTAPIEGRNYRTVARLKPGVTVAMAQAEMSAIAEQTARERPKMNEKWGALVFPLHEQVTRDIRPALIILFGAVVGVLLIACVNIANLLSMRSTARTREISVRLALGAGTGTVVQQLLIESLLLALIGGALGLALAYAGVPAIVAMFPAAFPLPRAREVGVDGWVLAFTFGASLVAGLLFGLAPALQARRRNLADTLHAGGRSIAGGSARMRAALVMAEVMLAVVLVIGAGLMVRSLATLMRVDPGFKPERVLTMRMFLSIGKYGGNLPRRVSIVDEILTRVRALPQVAAASTIHFLPLRDANSGTGYYRLDRPVPQPGDGSPRGGEVSVVSPGYFQAMQVPLLAGRDFDTRDRIDTPRAIIINQALAARFFPGENPLGKKMNVWWSSAARDGKVQWEIVGVAGNVHHAGLHLDVEPTLYISHAQEPNIRVSLVMRTTGDPLSVAAAVRQQIRALDPDQGVSDIDTMETVVAESLARPRLQTILLGAFGALALLMACIGIYGVLSYAVEQRRREMGVRLALGAAPGSILRLVVGEGLRLTAVGLGAGLLAAFVLTRYLSTLLYEVRPRDPVVFTTVSLTLVVVAVLSCWLPAHRAMRVDPASILRDE